MQTYAPNYVLELAWQALLTDIVGGLPINLSDTQGPTLHPNLTIVTTDLRDAVIGPNGFSIGVFWAKTKIQYEAKIAQTTPASAETAFGTIIQALFYSNSLATRLTEALDNFTCYGIKNFVINQAVQSNDKIWQKSVEMDVAFMTISSS
jgi:hypothetical protein